MTTALTALAGAFQSAPTPPMAVESQIDSASESELVHRYRLTGDNRCFEELYNRTSMVVFGICLRYLRDPGRAEDLCHETFLRAYRDFDGFRGTAFRAWACRIARNLCLNEVRHAAVVRRFTPELASPAHQKPAAEEALVGRERLEVARSIIRELSSDQRRVFLLRHLDGHSYREIAELTGFADNEVRSLLQNARRNFRIAWDRRRPGSEGDDDG